MVLGDVVGLCRVFGPGWYGGAPLALGRGTRRGKDGAPGFCPEIPGLRIETWGTHSVVIVEESFNLYQTRQVGVWTMGWPVLQLKAFWNSGRLETTPLMRAKPGE